MKVFQFNRNRFQSFKIPFKFAFHGFFPLHKIIFFEIGKNKHSHLSPPSLRIRCWVKKGYLFITFESFTKKSYLFGAANVKSQKGMILAGELQFYQFPIGISLPIPCCKRGNTTKPELGTTSIWHPPCSGESITNWRCNTHLSILLGQTGILRSLHWRYFLKCVQ